VESALAESRTDGYRRAFSFGVGGFVVNAVIAMFTTIVVARLYGIEVIGAFALASAPVIALWYLSTVGEQPALNRELASLEPRQPAVTALAAVVFLFSMALTAVVASLAALGSILLFEGPIDRPDLVAPTLVSLTGYLLLMKPCWSIDGVFAAFAGGRALFTGRTHQSVVFLATAIAASFVEESVWMLVVATQVSWATALFHRLFLLRTYLTRKVSLDDLRTASTRLRSIVTFGLRLMPGSLSYGASNEAGTWILGVYAPVAVVGAYNRAWMIAQRFLDLNYRITEILLPTIVRRREAGDVLGAEMALADSIRTIVTLMLVPVATGAGASEGVMDLFGPGFSQAADGLALMLFMPVLLTAAQIQGFFLIAIGQPGRPSRFAFLRLVVTVGLMLLLVPDASNGVTVAGLALAAGAGVQLASVTVATARALHHPVPELWPPRAMLALAAAAVVAFGVSSVVDAHFGSLAGLIAALAAGVSAFVAAVWLFGGLLERDRDRIRLVLHAGYRSRPTPT
jgi:O-antigen/teichoic acid export membrane protein